MADEPENHTIRLLQEMRAEMGQFRASVGDRFADLTNRINGNTVLLNMVAGMLHNHEERITKLERGRP